LGEEERLRRNEVSARVDAVRTGRPDLVMFEGPADLH